MSRSLFRLSRLILAIVLIAAGPPYAYAVEPPGSGGYGLDMVLLPATPDEPEQRLAVSWRAREPAQLELRVIDAFGKSHPIDPLRIEPGMRLLPLIRGVVADKVVGVVVDADQRPIATTQTAGVVTFNDVVQNSLPTSTGHMVSDRINGSIGWKPTFVGNSAPDSDVIAVTIYDDGTGPALIIGGTFLNASGLRVNRIARWNGHAWSPLGSGIEGNHLAQVSALLVYNGDLIAAGFFSSAGGVSANNIARWNGSEWAPLAGGLNNWVSTIAVHDGNLIAVGSFTEAGSSSASRIASWNGNEWSPIGDDFNERAYALTTHSGNLIAGGRFTGSGATPISRVAMWDGQRWVPIGDGVRGIVWTLVSHGPDLIAGGLALDADGYGHSIMRWGGQTWSPLSEIAGRDVYHLAILEGSIVANTGREIRRWNGTSWSSVSSKVAGGIMTMTVIGDRMLVGGNFNTINGIEAASVAQYDAGRWSSLDTQPNWWASAAGVFQNELLRTVSYYRDPAGPVPLPTGISRWSPDGWAQLGDEFNGSVSAVIVHQGDLIAAGQFSHVGGIQAQNIARWDGSSWRALGPGLNTQIQALASHGGELIAAGDSVMRWNGLEWRQMGPTIAWRVTSFALESGNLIAGAFIPNDINGPERGRVARWNGTTWIPMGADIPAPVGAVVVHEGAMYAAGGLSGRFVPVAYRWDGSQWNETGPRVLGPVRALLSVDGLLYSGGVDGLHRLDGSTWERISGGASITRLLSFGDDVVASGRFGGLGDIGGGQMVAFGPRQGSVITVSATSPHPAPEGEWVTIRAEVVGLSAPTRGHVTIVGTPGGSCSDLALEAIDATRSIAECAIRWNRPGTKRVRAHYVGGSDSVVTWQPSTSAEYEIVITPERLLNDGFETAGGTNAVAASVH